MVRHDPKEHNAGDSGKYDRQNGDWHEGESSRNAMPRVSTPPVDRGNHARVDTQTIWQRQKDKPPWDHFTPTETKPRS
jgi:hypothetical protein